MGVLCRASGEGVRFYRTVFLEEVGRDYVRTARAKGCGEGRVMIRHVLRNALIPILTQVVIAIPFLFTGSLLLESFFGIPGLGSLTVDAINGNDFATLRTMVYIGALLFILGQILTDVSYALVDPRVRLGVSGMEPHVVSNVVTAVLVAAGVAAAVAAARSPLWRDAARDLWRRRPVALAVVALYVLVALLDSIAVGRRRRRSDAGAPALGRRPALSRRLPGAQLLRAARRRPSFYGGRAAALPRPAPPRHRHPRPRRPPA